MTTTARLRRPPERPMRRRAPAFSSLCAALLLPLCALGLPALLAAEEPAPPAATGQEDHLRELLRQAETWRGLRAKQPVAAQTLNEPELAGKVGASLHEELPEDLLRSMEISLKSFGLIPESLDLAVFLPKLLTEQIAGYYDPEDQSLRLVRREGGVLGESGLDPEALDDMVLVHELTHALQDQHFDLERLKGADPMSDGATAREALIEGDATLTMLDAAAGLPVEEMPGAGELLAVLLEDSSVMAGAIDLPGSEALAAAPPYIRDTLMFSYLQGNLFCLSVRQKGGQKLLDHAFRSDPPLSSEQILHPEKWHGRRDDPVALTWPDLAPALPGFTKAAEGEMGELSVRILLRESLQDEERATAAAAGWGGDRFAVYEKGGRRLLAWITEWDAAADAEEFAAAAAQLGAGWRIERPAPQRVIVLKGELAPREAAAVLPRLAKAAARRPANRDIDMAALGIRDEDRAGADPEKLGKLLRDPEVRRRLAAMTGETQAELEKGTIDAEGRSFTSPGFVLHLPEAAVAEGWRIEPLPEQDGVMVRSRGGSGVVVFSQQGVPVGDLPLEKMPPLFEAGIRASVEDYKSLGGQVVEAAWGQVWEGRFEVGGTIPRRGLVRFFQSGTHLIFGMVLSPAEAWLASEPILRSILHAAEPAPAGGDR